MSRVAQTRPGIEVERNIMLPARLSELGTHHASIA